MEMLGSVESRNKDIAICSSGIKFVQNCRESNSHSTGLFASVGQAGFGFGILPNPPAAIETGKTITPANSSMKLVSMPETMFQTGLFPRLSLRGDHDDDDHDVDYSPFGIEDEGLVVMKTTTKKRNDLRSKLKIGNPSLRRLISGAIAGVVSRTAVAPLETIRTHLMVGVSGNSALEVFRSVVNADGWAGLYRGNFVNVIRVAPSKGIELFVYDTVKKHLSPKPGEKPKLPIPAPSVAGALAGVSSTLCTYPLELLKTRLTVQRGMYKNFLDAFMRIVKEEGPAELYRGLTPSIIGVIPFAATNYLAYDTLQKAYKKAFNKDEVGNVMTLLIGSTSSAFSSTVTFPLEVARKHMQAGAINGRQYSNMLHALVSILEKEGPAGLYRGLGPSWLKLIPAAGISFMCYEACKKILMEKQES
ncbi:hypothetical protein QN277_026302 [Acacia crassicarpa]|nr:hypothetical protein QN277_026302 [Acacia crassicarpa]